MGDPRLVELCREQRAIRAALKASVEASRSIARNPFDRRNTPIIRSLLLLRMAEGLIAAHMAAKVDGDGYTLDVIEDALRHVGKRLARETTDGESSAGRRPGVIE